MFHIHTYFDPSTREKAEHLRREMLKSFDAKIGPMRDEPVGPHPKGMFLASIQGPITFASLTFFVMRFHEDLSVLIHPCTGDALFDHTTGAAWLGEKLDLNLDRL